MELVKQNQMDRASRCATGVLQRTKNGRSTIRLEAGGLGAEGGTLQRIADTLGLALTVDLRRSRDEVTTA